MTHDVQHAAAARACVERVLGGLGVTPTFGPDPIPGILAVFVPEDPRRLLQAAAEACRADPGPFAHTHRWRRVDAWVPARLEPMREAVEGLRRRIRTGDRWRMTVEVHGPSPWHASDLVVPLTDPIREGTVDLEHAAKEVRVDIVGDQAAVAVLGPDDHFSVDQARRASVPPPAAAGA